MNTLTVRQLSKSFGLHKVLDRLSLTVRAGEIFGLLGPSGAGKTTLTSILTGQLSMDEGHILTDGQDGLPSPSRVGIMMDNWGLYDRMTVYDNLRFFAIMMGADLSKIDPLLARTGLSSARNRAVSRLSKGMRSRVCFCRALLKNEEILFLDEPTSGLDPGCTQTLHQMILEEKERGCAVFLTTHNMHEAETLCDEVALLHEGHIVESGAPHDICRRYDHLKTIRVETQAGKILEFPNSTQGLTGICQLSEKEPLASVHTSEPNLEKVFLELTGKELNADDTESEAGSRDHAS